MPGEFRKGSSEKTPLRMVSVTFWPSAMAPMNSVIVASCQRVSGRHLLLCGIVGRHEFRVDLQYRLESASGTWS